jgi:hypothetical protein
MRPSRIVRTEAYRWLVLTLLAGLVAISTSLADRNVYSRATVDAKMDTVMEMHDRDLRGMQRQLDHIEQQTDRLVEHLISEGD